MLARRMMKKNDSPRATIFTINTEMLEISPSAAAEDVAVPAGFKQKG